MIRPAALALLLCLAVAGCADPAEPAAPTDSAPVTAAPLAGEPEALLLAIEPPAPTESDSITLSGTVSKPAEITVWGTDGEGGDAIYTSGRVHANGTWNVTLTGLVFGHTAVEAFADDGTVQAVATAVVVRLATATFEAVYTASPGHDPTSDQVLYDPDTLSSASMYEGTDFERPGYFTVHDLMVAWTAQTGTPIEYSGPGAFGFGVNRIDGVGQPLDSALPPYWCYTINGESADLGISLQAAAPGDLVTWEYGPCA